MAVGQPGGLEAADGETKDFAQGVREGLLAEGMPAYGNRHDSLCLPLNDLRRLSSMAGARQGWPEPSMAWSSST